MTTATTTRPSAGTRREPSVVTVFRAHDGSLGHARCGCTLRYLGARGGRLELDFYCQACHEHVTLPYTVVSRVLEGQPASNHVRAAAAARSALRSA
jgi:hypothetical protein